MEPYKATARKLISRVKDNFTPEGEGMTSVLPSIPPVNMAYDKADKVQQNIMGGYTDQANALIEKTPAPSNYGGFYGDEYSALGHNDYKDALRHAGTAMYMTADTPGMIPSALKAPAVNLMGAAHELLGAPSRNRLQYIKETGSDLYNNAVGSAIGSVPFTGIETKEKMLKWAERNNVLSDLRRNEISKKRQMDSLHKQLDKVIAMRPRR